MTQRSQKLAAKQTQDSETHHARPGTDSALDAVRRHAPRRRRPCRPRRGRTGRDALAGAVGPGTPGDLQQRLPCPAAGMPARRISDPLPRSGRRGLRRLRGRLFAALSVAQLHADPARCPVSAVPGGNGPDRRRRSVAGLPRRFGDAGVDVQRGLRRPRRGGETVAGCGPFVDCAAVVLAGGAAGAGGLFAAAGAALPGAALLCGRAHGRRRPAAGTGRHVPGRDPPRFRRAAFSVDADRLRPAASLVRRPDRGGGVCRGSRRREKWTWSSWRSSCAAGSTTGRPRGSSAMWSCRFPIRRARRKRTRQPRKSVSHRLPS